ncbi:MAG TPA: M56 family metallopeptidase [Candidatus Polarisedimenticolia bacterium]|nr:M56 family metallopeptidase [Candidatus Polarisedimenticolia bacterium]
MPADVFLLLAAGKAAVPIALALLAAVVARRASAAFRHAVLAWGMAGALAMPLLAWTLPALLLPLRSHGLYAGAPPLSHLADEAVLLAMTRGDVASGIALPATWRAAAERAGGWLLAVWLAGASVGLARIAADLAAARRVRLRAVPLGFLAGGLPLLSSAEIDAPVCVGPIRPAIMIPEGAALEGSSLRAALRHERAHAERRDCLTLLMARACCALHWFDPLSWMAARRMALEREAACDDRVLEDGADPIAYSRLLLAMAAGRAVSRAPAGAASSMARPAQLEARLKRILAGGGAPARPVTACRRAALALAACLIITPLAALAVHDGLGEGDVHDPYADPRSERVDGERPAPSAPPDEAVTGPDRRLIETLRHAARAEPETGADLVPDRARWALSRVRDGRLLGPLLESLDDPDWRVRAYAAWGLAVAADPAAVRRLLPLLDHPVWRERAMAAFALRSIGDPAATEAMAGALSDPAWQVRMEAARFLGERGGPRLGDRIEALLRDPHIAVRLAADQALRSAP